MDLLTYLVLNTGKVEMTSGSNVPAVPSPFFVYRTDSQDGVYRFSVCRFSEAIADCCCAKLENPTAERVWEFTHEHRHKHSIEGSATLPRKLLTPWVSISLKDGLPKDQEAQTIAIAVGEATVFCGETMSCRCGARLAPEDAAVVHGVLLCPPCGQRFGGLSEEEFKAAWTA